MLTVSGFACERFTPLVVSRFLPPGRGSPFRASPSSQSCKNRPVRPAVGRGPDLTPRELRCAHHEHDARTDNQNRPTEAGASDSADHHDPRLLASTAPTGTRWSGPRSTASSSDRTSFYDRYREEQHRRKVEKELRDIKRNTQRTKATSCADSRAARAMRSARQAREPLGRLEVLVDEIVDDLAHGRNRVQAADDLPAGLKFTARAASRSGGRAHGISVTIICSGMPSGFGAVGFLPRFRPIVAQHAAGLPVKERERTVSRSSPSVCSICAAARRLRNGQPQRSGPHALRAERERAAI